MKSSTPDFLAPVTCFGRTDSNNGIILAFFCSTMNSIFTLHWWLNALGHCHAARWAVASGGSAGLLRGPLCTWPAFIAAGEAVDSLQGWCEVVSSVTLCQQVNAKASVSLCSQSINCIFIRPLYCMLFTQNGSHPLWFTGLQQAPPSLLLLLLLF